jgi:hypothetical protein
MRCAVRLLHVLLSYYTTTLLFSYFISDEQKEESSLALFPKFICSIFRRYYNLLNSLNHFKSHNTTSRQTNYIAQNRREGRENSEL